MMAQGTLVEVGPRVAGVKCGMVVREIATGKRGEVVEVVEPGARFAVHCFYVGDVAVDMYAGGYRVCGPAAYFWTQFELVEGT